MKLYKAQTGDGSITLIISAENRKKAIKLSNEYYHENGYDDGSGFKFDKESVSKLKPASVEMVMDAFTDEMF